MFSFKNIMNLHLFMSQEIIEFKPANKALRKFVTPVAPHGTLVVVAP